MKRCGAKEWVVEDADYAFEMIPIADRFSAGGLLTSELYVDVWALLKECGAKNRLSAVQRPLLHVLGPEI